MSHFSDTLPRETALTTPMTTAAVSLVELEVGRSGRFQRAALDDEALDMLNALGLTTDSVVRLCKKGEPCIVQVRSTRIGLSCDVAGAIYVVPETDVA